MIGRSGLGIGLGRNPLSGAIAVCIRVDIQPRRDAESKGTSPTPGPGDATPRNARGTPWAPVGIDPAVGDTEARLYPLLHPMPRPDPLAQNLVRACKELFRRRPWNRTEPDAPILIRVPTEEEPLAGILIGLDGGGPGLFLFYGPDALERLHRNVLGRAVGNESWSALDELGVTFTAMGEIPPECRKTLELAGVQARRENRVPDLYRTPPHRESRPLNRREMKTILWCLGAIFVAEDRGEMHPRPLQPGSLALELVASGKMRSPQVESRLSPWSTTEVGDAALAISLPDDLAALPRRNELWSVCSPPLPGRLEGDDRAWNGLVLADEIHGRWVSSTLVPRGDAESLVVPLVRAFRDRGLPRQVLILDEHLSKALTPSLTALGVRVGVDPFHPRYLEIHESLLFIKQSATGPEWARMTPESREEWEEIQGDFKRRLSIRANVEDLITSRAIRRYFGERDLAELLDEPDDFGAYPSFFEWSVPSSSGRWRTTARRGARRPSSRSCSPGGRCTRWTVC